MEPHRSAIPHLLGSLSSTHASVYHFSYLQSKRPKICIYVYKYIFNLQFLKTDHSNLHKLSPICQLGTATFLIFKRGVRSESWSASASLPYSLERVAPARCTMDWVDSVGCSLPGLVGTNHSPWGSIRSVSALRKAALQSQLIHTPEPAMWFQETNQPH